MSWEKMSRGRSRRSRRLSLISKTIVHTRLSCRIGINSLTASIEKPNHKFFFVVLERLCISTRAFPSR